MERTTEFQNRINKIKECLDEHDVIEARYEHHLEETVVEYECTTCDKHYTLHYKLDKITL